MALGYVGFGQPGNLQQASPALWSDCLNTILNDKGLGRYISQDFLGDYATPAATTTPPGIQFTATGTSVFTEAASATYGPHVLSAATGGSDNDHFQLRGAEMIQIVKNSGKKVWFETRFAVGALNDSAFFLGLTTRANAVVAAGPIADNPSNSAVATMTSASFIGFVSVQASSALATVNAVYEKTTGTPVTVLADVTNATALKASQANLSPAASTQAQVVTDQGTGDIPEGEVAAYGNLVANAFRKFGIRFDGATNLEFYVDGVKVATQSVDTTVDQAAFYVPVVAVKTGTAAATTNYVDFIKAAYAIRS